MKRSGFSGIAIGLTSGLILLAGCEKAETPMPKIGSAEQPAAQPEVKQGEPSGAATTGQNDRESTLQMARQELDQLKTKIDALKVKAKDASAALKEKLSTDIQGFEKDLKELEKKFSALKDASATAWQDMKASFAASIDKLKGSVDKSSEKSNSTGSSY